MTFFYQCYFAKTSSFAKKVFPSNGRKSLLVLTLVKKKERKKERKITFYGIFSVKFGKLKSVKVKINFALYACSFEIIRR